MIHTIKIRDTDAVFELDPKTRNFKDMQHPSIMQFDHNSERVSFVLPKFIEGHDMTECSKVEVHYINGSTAGVYEITDLETLPDDESKVRCSWLISQNATMNAGVLHFLLRLSCVGDDGAIEYAWNSNICKVLQVNDGIYNTDDIVEQHADVLEQWKQEMFQYNQDTSKAIAEISKIQSEHTTLIDNIEAGLDDCATKDALEKATQWKTLTDVTLTEEQAGVSEILLAIEDVEAFLNARQIRIAMSFPVAEEKAANAFSTIIRICDKNRTTYSQTVLSGANNKGAANSTYFTTASIDVFDFKYSPTFKRSYHSLMQLPTPYYATSGNTVKAPTAATSGLDTAIFNTRPPHLLIILSGSAPPTFEAKTHIFMEVCE